MKLTKKEQKVRAEKAALRQRLYDMALGANGGCDLGEAEGDDTDDWLLQYMGAKAFGNFCSCVCRTFQLGIFAPEAGHKYAGADSCLEYFAELDRLVDHLYQMDIRA